MKFLNISSVRNFLRSFLFCILMVYGTTAAHAVDYIYNIINNSGQLVMRVKSTKTKAYLPDRARTPFAQNYHYYKTLVEAQNDARYGEDVAEGSYGAHAFDDNVAISTMGLTAGSDGKYQIYVRYDYEAHNTKVKDNNNQAVRIDGSRAYNFQISTRMVYYSTDTGSYTTPRSSQGKTPTVTPKASEPIRVTATSNVSQVSEADRELSNYKWLFIGTKAGFLGSLGQPDPYDIKIVNVEQYALDKTKVLTAVNTQALPLTPTTNTYLHLAYSTDGAVATNVYRFFFRMIGTQVQVMAAKNLFVYNGENNNPAEGQWFVMNKEKDEPDWNDFHDETCFPSLHMREHGKQEGGNGGDRATTLYYVRPTHQYVIVGSDGTQRAKAYAPVDDDVKLKVPASIATVVPVTYTYYASLADAQNATSALETLPPVSTTPVIYVRYAYEAGNSPLVKLNGSARYTVSINGHYVKYDETGAYNSHVAPGSTQEAENGSKKEYIWHTWGDDPYGIYITNEEAGDGNYFTGTSTTGTIAMGSSGASAAIQMTNSYTDYTPGRYYLVASPQYTLERPSFLFRSVYTGDDDFYTWGYFGTEETTADDWDGLRPRLFKSSLVGDDNDALWMEIYELRDNDVNYHIIDKQGREVISAANKKVFLAVPDEIYSPLVSTYHYYTLDQFNVSDGVYTLKSGATEITDRVTTGRNDIYVTYDTGTEIDISGVEYQTTAGKNKGKYTDNLAATKTKYMIRFLNGQSYYQEDGKDGLTDGVHTTRKNGGSNATLGTLNKKYKAEYAYINGDGGFNVYCDSVRTTQFTNAANERTRWSWYIDGDIDNDGVVDPYHVHVQAASNVGHPEKSNYDNDHKNDDPTDNYYDFFRTYDNSTLGKVVTGTISNDPRATNTSITGGADTNIPTEYMLLGRKGRYRLVTTNKINGSHQTVNSLEQYWKLYEVIRKVIQENIINTPTAEQKTMLASDNPPLSASTIATLKSWGWHQYDSWAYSRPWAGWNTDAKEDMTKSPNYGSHWYQTFDVGEEFELVKVVTDPVVILVDNHGWEVFRHPMPTQKDRNSDDNLGRWKFIKSYDSNMVTYHWYKEGRKETGAHLYELSEPAMKADGSGEYTSESLIDFPPNYGDHVGDWYVSYEVKDAYRHIYSYDGSTGKSVPVLIRQSDQWADASETTIGSSSAVTINAVNKDNVQITGTPTNDMIWYLAPNTSFYTEMGFDSNPSTITYTTEQMCFDPYNVQIRNADNSKYFKTAATDATLEKNQHWLATNPYNIGLGNNSKANFTAGAGHDNKVPNITNATFMILSDANDHWRLVPRFDHESAVTNLTGGSPTVDDYIYDFNITANEDGTATVTPTSAATATQNISFYPIQRYQFHIRDMASSGSAPDVLTSEEFYAQAGSSLIHQLSNLTAPLPVEYIRAYCEYQGAFTNFDSSTNTYSGEVTSYPPGTENGIELTHIYVPYTVVSTAAFFNTEAEAVASNNWMFLLQGTESVATIFGKKLIDYGMEVRYGFRDAAQSENIGDDMPDLTPAERSFVWNSGKYGGFHFLRRGGTPTVNVNTGAMSFATGQETVLSTVGSRRIASKDSTASVYLLSPLNDFRRIAETYIEGSETSFRESSWLWAFIGTPYKFYAINREDALANAEGSRKRLAVAAKKSDKELLVLTDGYQTGETYDPRQAGAYWFTMSKYAVQTDEEASNTFALQLWDGDNIEKNDSCIGKGSSANEFVKAPKNLIKKGTADQPDIAVMKVSSFRAYPWNWDDKKYQAVTVNIYPGTQENHGALALTKTYTRADRAFIAGDVLDGTDGHFYLRIEAQEDGSWKPNGIVENTMPYDHHLINIPYELRRRYCKYTIEGGSFTVQQDDSDNPTPQVLNIYYTVDTDKAPLFVSEDELESFRNYINADAEGTFKDGKKYSDYFYFLDMEWGMWSHLYANDNKQGGANGNRFAVGNPKQMMWYFVGDPYNVRLFNVYTDLEFSGETRNFVRHRYADMEHHSTGYNNSDNAADDNKTFMENVSNKVFSWEMVDPYVGNSSNNGIAYSGEYSIANNSNAAYRLSQVEDKPFALRMKMVKEETEEIIRDATYYYLGRNGTTEGTHLYNYNGETLYHRLNNQNAFPTYPDNRHSANSVYTTITPLKPTKVYVTVYDPDEPTRKVTDNEVSDFFAVTDRFKGVPDNLQRNYCDYWWVSTDPDIKSTNMVDENLYYTIESENSHIYARYRESDNSPFSTLVDGVPVLKRDADANPWYNMNIGNWWAFFNSSLDGKTYPVNNVGGNVLNNSVLSFVYKGSKLNPTYPAEKFRKGLQWALVGDPYNFTIRNNRDIITIENGVATKTDGDYEYNSAYLNQTAIATTGTTWTWLRNATTTDNYFLSESAGRRTEVVASNSSGAKGFGAPRRILPSDYTISAQSETRNFTVVDSNGNSSITTGDNYTTGSKMFLLSVEDESVQNESFDAIVNVYNKMNELVATTGWTELARSNAEWSGEIPTDVQRWGCNYHYWADETMTRYPFNSFSQKDDSGNYLIKDGDVVYVTYDYDESLYSSENEYRWVNLFFNWDNDYKKWEKQTVTGKSWYTAEYWEWEKNNQKFVKRYDHPVTQSYEQWTETDLYTQTENRWLESPATTTEGSYDKDKAYAYYNGGQYTDATDAKKQKWAMIGDPYRFILYNYNRKAEAGADNSYYLNYSNSDIKSEKLSFDSDHPKDTWQGLYWTWKIDGQRFTFAQGDNMNNTTTWTKLDGLPESFYKDYTAAEATSDVAEKKDGYSIQSGYLALCDMEATSEYDKDQLIGSVSGYATFKHRYLETTQLTNGTGDDKPLTYYTGTQEKFKEYKNNGVVITSDFDYTSPDNKVEVLTDRTQEETGDPIYEEVSFPEKWRATYANGYTYDGNGIYTSGPYIGYYVGPIESIENDIYTSHTTYKSVQELKYENVQGTEQYLQLTENLIPQSAEEMPVPRFLVMPMAAQAKSITFHLDTKTYSDGSTAQSLRSADNIIFDHTSENYGVGNTLALPWMMRRQYCDYKFYLVGAYDKDDDSNNLAAQIANNKIDDLTYASDVPSNTHRLTDRGSTYSDFWTSGTDLTTNTNVYNSEQHEFVVPEEWKDKDVFIRVTYQPTAEFTAMQSSGSNAAKWLNVMNVENGNMMRYTRSGNVTGENRDSLNDVTNDYLWAIEGDPYGFVLHNRYADHGFNGSVNEFWDTKKLETTAVNATLNYNSSAGGGITFGPAGEATAPGTMGNGTYKVYEAMTGNYTESMLIHPVDACINVRNQNGYKYTGAFMFNGAPTGDPVQLNYMQDWEVMRNVYANWLFVKPAAKQFLPYYNRAGFVGGLKTDVAAAAANKAIFDKIAAGTTLNNTEYNTVWSLVQNPANLVPFDSGKLYRLKAYSAGNGVVGGDYVSGYLHKTELDDEKPLHIFSKAGVASNISSLLSYDGNEWAADVANKSLLEIPDIEFDPSSIFYVTRDENGYVKMETQGLVVSDSKMMAVPAEPTTEQANSMLFEMQDIGLGAFQMRTKANVTGENAETSYLSCNPNTLKYGLNAEAKELNIASGISSGATVKTHDTKWLLEPVGTTATNPAMKVKMLDMGNDDFYATACFPFDVKLPNGAYAFGFQNNNDGSIRGEKKEDGTFQINIAQIAGYDEASPKDNENHPNMVVPAGVPVLLYIYNDQDYLGDLTSASELPLMMASEGECKLTEGQIESLRTSEMKYQYLTQKLKGVASNKTIFVFSKASGKTGFMRNANKDYTGATNNRFVAHNKIYYVGDYGNNASSAKVITLNYTTLFDPDDFKETDGINEIESDDTSIVESRKDNDVIYDLHGRRIEHVNRTGIYIVNGRKVLIKK